MNISGVSADQFGDLVCAVSRREYDGNLIPVDVVDLGGVRRPRIRGRIAVRDSYAYGARTSASGRHGKWASWHAYRDVLAELFLLHPRALVVTGIARYDGRQGFEDNFPRTANTNKGSVMVPAPYAFLSVPRCGDERPRRTRADALRARVLDNAYRRVNDAAIFETEATWTGAGHTYGDPPEDPFAALAVDEEWTPEQVAKWLMTREGMDWSQSRQREY